MTAPLVLAVPSKGRLQENAESFFARAGLTLAKSYRLVDKKAIQAAKKTYSELSGQPATGEPHHILCRALGGPDHPYNLIQLTRAEHMDADDGKIPMDKLFIIKARQFNITLEDVKQEVERLRAK